MRALSVDDTVHITFMIHTTIYRQKREKDEYQKLQRLNKEKKDFF